MLKIMKNNVTALKGLKMFTLRHMSLRSESEAKSLLPLKWFHEMSPRNG